MEQFKLVARRLPPGKANFYRVYTTLVDLETGFRQTSCVGHINAIEGAFTSREGLSCSRELLTAVLEISALISKASENDNLRPEYTVDYPAPKIVLDPRIAVAYTEGK